jgi:acyl dehydratase
MRFDELKPGDELPPFVKGPITRQHLVEWCAAENDYYYLHYDERVAERMKLAGTPIQGTLKMALLGQMIARWTGRGGSLRAITTAYRGLSLEGDTLTCRGKVVRCERQGNEGLVDLELWVENADGERSTTAAARIALPLASG